VVKCVNMNRFRKFHDCLLNIKKYKYAASSCSSQVLSFEIGKADFSCCFHVFHHQIKGKLGGHICVIGNNNNITSPIIDRDRRACKNVIQQFVIS